MKKTTISFVLLLVVFNSFAQEHLSNEILIRHDTTTLKAEECSWIIKSLLKTDEPGKSVPLIILQAISQGKLKAVDPGSGLPIPADKIFTWQMATDTVATIDNSGNMQYKVLLAEHNTYQIPLIRIYQDWYFGELSGKFRSEIKYIELIEEVKNAAGNFIGYHAFCRINY